MSVVGFSYEVCGLIAESYFMEVTHEKLELETNCLCVAAAA